MYKQITNLFLLTLTLVFVGCASVSVVKIPAKSQYTEWGDEQQRKADEIEGSRYYLPRPYMVVKKPFPVDGGDYYVKASVNADGTVAEIDPATLPQALKELFPNGTVPGNAIFTDPSRAIAAQSTGTGAAATNTGAEAPKPTFKPEPLHLKGSESKPNTLQKSETDFKVTIKFSKAAVYGPVDKTTVRVGLVPLDDKFKIKSEFIELSGTTATTDFVAGTTDGLYVANGRRTDLVKSGSRYAVALKFTENIVSPQKETTYVVHQETLDLSVVGIDEPAKKVEEKETKKEQDSSVKTQADLTTSGDPNTDPLMKINDLFDVVLLPDFDEQYAMQVKAGLGDANAKIGLENGWMVEQASIGISNAELGKFIFSEISKITDMGIDVAKAYLQPASLLAPDAATPESKGLKNAPDKEVVLRIRYNLMAQPGLYPFLKPREDMAKGKKHLDIPHGGSAATLHLPYRPYTVIAYNVRREVLVELVSVNETPAGGGNDSAGSGSDSSFSDTATLKTLLETTQITVEGITYTITNVADVAGGSGNVEVTLDIDLSDATSEIREAVLKEIRKNAKDAGYSRKDKLVLK